MATRKIERTIRLWRTHGQVWEWQVTTWRGTTWLARASGLADSEVAARQNALAYHAQYPLRAPSGTVYNWAN
jgi:hypothetical protein